MSNDTVVSTVVQYDNELMLEDEAVRELDFKGITNYFLGFWNATHATEALMYMEVLERRSHLRNLQKKYGSWRPPPEVAEALKKPIKPTNFSNLPDSKETKDLKFVLKILGCPLNENRPYKQFLKAQTHRQKRNWLYKYQGPAHPTRANCSHSEPICATRLRRLYHFFPDRFTLEEDNVYFNDHLLTYDGRKKLFFLGIERKEDSDVHWCND